ncbi:MAG: hypothetical protein AB7P02_11440 [Alphaproteobacteria bacterium]
MAGVVDLFAASHVVAGLTALARRADARWLVPRGYREIEGALPPKSGAIVFGDLDRVDDDLAVAAERLAADAAVPGVRVLNHPVRTLRRYELLRMLHADAENPIDVLRVEDRRPPRRWPVILRTESGMLRRQPTLIHDQGSLDAELRRLDALDAYRPDLLIVEVPMAGRTIGPTLRLLKAGDRLLPLDPVGGRNPLDRPAEGDWLSSVFARGEIDFGHLCLCRIDGRIAILDIGTDSEIVVQQGARPDVLGALASIADN